MKDVRLLLALGLLAVFCVQCGTEEFPVPDASTQADFTYTITNNGIAPCEVIFLNESANATTYEWDFGNGETSSEENPSINFSDAGTYTVRLSVGSENPDLHYNTLEKVVSIAIRDQPIKRLYFTDRTDGRVKYIALDGSPVPIIQEFSHSGMGKPYGMCIDTIRGKVYCTDYKYQLMFQYNMDGSDVQTLMSEPTRNFDSPFGIFALEDKIYWADTAGIHRANLDGTGTEVFIDVEITTAPEMPLDIAYDHIGDRIFFTNDKYEFSGGVYVVDMDGSNLTKLVDGTNGGALALDANADRMYYYDHEKGMCMNTLDGKNEVVFDASQMGSFTWGLAVDADGGKIYYPDKQAGTIKRANLDGSDVEVFIPAEAEIFPHAMAIDKFN